MKTIFTTIFVAFLAFTTSAVATDSAPSGYSEKKPTSCFNYFRAHRQGHGVGMTWSVGTGDVVSFVVERSYDGEYYDAVSGIACNGAMQHKFIDSDIFPGTIYYRVRAVKADGTSECSNVESVRIVKRG